MIKHNTEAEAVAHIEAVAKGADIQVYTTHDGKRRVYQPGSKGCYVVVTTATCDGLHILCVDKGDGGKVRGSFRDEMRALFGAF